VDDLVELFRRVVRGDTRAFADAVDRTSRPRYRAARRMLGNTADAEEVVQESFVRAHEALRRGRFEEGTRAYAWLLSIVTRASIDALRRRKLRPVPVSDVPERWLEAGAEDAEHAARVGELLLCMDALPSDQRVALVLRYLEGLSNAEVADALSITEGAVEQRLIRAKATLRRKLNGDEDE
jgi:RNA polymerase sigma-70 factor (ECF subfamily)